MSDPTDPNVTAARDANASAASSADETAPMASGKPKFGPPAEAGEVGTLGPYRLVKQLGAGGMGAVYLAIDTRLDRKLALKVMLQEFAANREAKERFLREAKSAAKVSHDNVVTVFEADERDGVPYIAMQFLQGYPLDEYLKNKGTPPLAHVIRIVREAALGLAAAHDLGLVHRDIKPGNLWLEAPNGRVKVLDFGLAKPVGSETELTSTGAVVGTPAYMSPEQARGVKIDARTDLFSLGALLYRLCTGRTPFNGPNVMAVLMALGSDDPTPVRELNPNVPEPLAELIHQLLAKKPEQRPQTAAEVAKRLQGILAQALNPGAVAPAAVPAGSGDLSVSQPVVVHALPLQPPNVVPMSVTAAPESAFAGLGDDEGDEGDATQADAPAPRREPKPPREPKKGGKGVLIGVAVTALLAVVAVAAVVSQMGKKGDSDAAKTPDAPPDTSKATPKGKNPSPLVPASAKTTDLPPLPLFEWKPTPAGLSPFDKLDANAIPKEERFDWQPKELVAVIGTHERRYWGEGVGLDFSPDGKWLVYAGTGDGTGDYIVRVIDRATNRTTFTHRLPHVSGIRFAPNGRSLLVTIDKTLLAADFAGGTWEAKPLAPKDALGWALPILASDGKTLLILLGPSGYQVWDATADGYALRKPLAHKGVCIGFTADGSAAYLEKQDAPGQPWVVERVSLAKGDDTATAVLTFPPADGPIWNGSQVITKVSPDGTRLVTCEKGGESKTCVLYDLTQTPAKEVARFECALHGPIAFSPDSKILYRRFECVDLTATPPRKLEPLFVGERFALSPDAKTVAVAHRGMIVLYDVSGPKPVEVSPPKLPFASANSHFSQPCVVAGRRGLVGVTAYRDAATDGTGALMHPVGQFWDLTGAKPVPWPNEASSAVGVPGAGLGSPLKAINPDGSFATFNTSTFGVQRAQAGPSGFAVLKEPASGGTSGNLAADDGFTLARSAKGGDLVLWDIREPFEKARPLPELADLKIDGAVFHAGRGLLVTNDEGAKETTLWKLTGDKLVAVEVIPQHLPSLRLSPDGRWLAALPGGGGKLALCDLSGARPKPGSDLGNLGRVVAAAFSADARALFTCNVAGDLRGHDLASGREVWQAKLPGFAAWLYAAPDGRHLFTHNSNGTVYVLRLPDLTAKADADRAAAEWALSVGGTVRALGQERDVSAVNKLPAGALLQIVNLNTSKATDEGLANLKGCASLTDLYLQGTKVNGTGLAALKDCANLTSLDVTSTAVTDEAFVHLKPFAQLRHLTAGHNPISDTGLEHLAGMIQLTDLDVRKTKVTAAGVQRLAKALPNCRIEWDGGKIEPKK